MRGYRVSGEAIFWYSVAIAVATMVQLAAILAVQR